MDEDPPLKEQVASLEISMPLFAFSHGSIHIVQDDQSYRVVICCPLVLIPFEQGMRECYNLSIDSQTWTMCKYHLSQQRYNKF